jgi:hypothetical protein
MQYNGTRQADGRASRRPPAPLPRTASKTQPLYPDDIYQQDSRPIRSPASLPQCRFCPGRHWHQDFNRQMQRRAEWVPNYISKRTMANGGSSLTLLRNSRPPSRKTTPTSKNASMWYVHSRSTDRC